MGSNNPAAAWADKALLEQPLNEDEIMLRKLFVDFYLQTYEPVSAAISCGFLPNVASEFAIQFMSEGFVRRLIHKREKESSPEEDNRDKRRVRSLLFELANKEDEGSSHSARVSALKVLAGILGMTKGPTDNKGLGGPAGGVMVVPTIGDIEGWSNDAQASQSELKKAVHES